MSPRARPSAYDQSVKLLARRSHFRQELIEKLSQRGYDDEDIESALGRLTDQGVLDDTSAARELIANRIEKGGRGRARILADLLDRGVDRDEGDELLDELYPLDAELEVALDEARRQERMDDPSRDTLARRLSGRGFAPETISKVLEEVESEASAV